MISEIPRKSLPAIARAVRLKDRQSWYHFLRDSPYVDNLGKTANGILSVNAYGVVDGITNPIAV